MPIFVFCAAVTIVCCDLKQYWLLFVVDLADTGSSSPRVTCCCQRQRGDESTATETRRVSDPPSPCLCRGVHPFHKREKKITNSIGDNGRSTLVAIPRPAASAARSSRESGGWRRPSPTLMTLISGHLGEVREEIYSHAWIFTDAAWFQFCADSIMYMRIMELHRMTDPFSCSRDQRLRVSLPVDNFFVSWMCLHHYAMIIKRWQGYAQRSCLVVLCCSLFWWASILHTVRVARFLNMSRRRDGSSSWSYVMGNKGGGQHQVGRGGLGLFIFNEVQPSVHLTRWYNYKFCLIFFTAYDSWDKSSSVQLHISDAGVG